MVETKKIQRSVLEPLHSRGEAREPLVGLKRVCSFQWGLLSLKMKISQRVQFI